MDNTEYTNSTENSGNSEVTGTNTDYTADRYDAYREADSTAQEPEQPAQDFTQPAQEFTQPAQTYTQTVQTYTQPAAEVTQPSAQQYTQPAPRYTVQNDAYAQYASGYGYVPGSSAPAPRAYAPNYVIPDVPKKAKKQRRMPAFLKVILAAALFGIVAAGVFMLTNELYYRIRPSASSEASAVPGTNKGHASRTSTTSDANVVASTALVTDVNTTATDVSPVVESAMPSIVSIDCTFLNTSFFGTYESAGAGSGIILKKTDNELLISTNNHVVANSTSINVTFCDGSTASAVIKGTDATADLAVISIDLESLTKETLAAIKVATLGNSDDIKVGQMVVAIGNSMGYGQSTTVGYVSAKDREVTVESTVMTLLQTDAAINPGNSGGALLNLKGEVIGINSVKYADESVEGMGFAIPISRAIAILDELAARETLADNEKGYLGVYIKDVSSDMAAAYNIPVGAYVADFTEGSPAKDGGIQVGDIITAVNGISISTGDDLRNAVTSYRAGTTVTITHYRLINGRYTELTTEITLITNPSLSE